MDTATLVAVALAGGQLTCQAPDDWREVAPRVNLIEKEFSIEAPEGSEAAAARLTIATAGGSVDANVARWIGQFRGNEGGADRSSANVTREEVDGMPTTLLDLSGTYLESSRGPFGPKTPRKDYRMVAAIVENTGTGTYFFKLVGPEATVAEAADAFRAMVRSLEKAD